jgi:tetratricopeptide (TPR) repeat protein
VWFRLKPNLLAGCGEPNNLLDEALLSTIWGEWARAVGLWKLMLALVDEENGVTLRAEILEGIERAENARAEYAHQLPLLFAQVREQPKYAELHFRLGLILSALGEGEGALREYEAALRNPKRLCRECFRDLWNNIGWQYFRTRNLMEARRWLEQAYVVASCDESPGRGSCRLALENRMLVYSQLGPVEEAAAVQEYYRRS